MKIIFDHSGFEISDENGNITNIRRMIIEMDEKYYYVSGEIEGFRKILNFPDHMKNEWFKYNKRELTLDNIEKFEKLIEPSYKPIAISFENTIIKKEYERKLLILKSIRRDFIIGKI